MKTVVIIGASGVVGSRVLAHLLDREEVGRVVALGRRLLDVQHAKLVSKVVDLQNATEMAGEIPDDVAVAICCIGTTRKQAGSKEAFRAIDRDAVVAFGRAGLQKGAQRFLVVSSIGANPRSKNFYLKTKGQAEEALAQLGYPQLTIVRPSFLDDRGARPEFRLGERIALPLARAIFFVVGKKRRYAPIAADVVGKALVRLAFDDATEPVRIVESDQLHAIGG
ncbi:MAG: NAD(P)H-binding protein [Bradymonadales bacterium]|nr:NAD(P)H-binding protein [Bradymonadales bacterium]